MEAEKQRAKQLVVGILAHVDSGKTTLSEAMLYRSGTIRKLGRVDHKDAFLDTDALEKARGITIFSKQALLTAGETAITLLDTPGHVDFSTETERTLQVLDYAVLVISGTDGVQSHTETLWRLLRRYHIPTFVFINKMDLPGPGKEKLLEQLNHRLGEGFVDFGADEDTRDEALAVCDERLMEAVLEGMAEYYSVELSQKIRRGMDINAEKCLSTGGNLALGFRVDREKHIQIDPDTAPVVQKIFETYASGQSMADIIRYLNANHIKTSYGNEFNKNSLNRILRNKRYIGVYTYRGTETPDGLPRIISDDLFYEVQDMMDKKKKAPARAKAFENYILSTKLFCGYCQAAMTGISGTSKTGTKYHYYQCVTNRRDKSCHKKTASKAYIEDLVIKETRKLLTKENIDRIAKEVVRLCEQEKDTDNLKQLKRLLKENERATENLFKALESGQIVDVIAERISQKKRERNELEQQILVETSSHPTPTVNEVRFFLNQFRKGDVNDLKYRQALVDTFVNKIYLYDDKMTVLYNTQDSHSDVTIDDLSSSRVALVEARGVEPLSESTLTGFSPGAGGYWRGLTPLVPLPAASRHADPFR